MYNEITRKLTSLTLMTIMVAGGMSVGMLQDTPMAFAAGELTVSAEAVGNFAGIQVIEIVVNDPDRSSTNESEGVPNVEINGDNVLMAQGSDGAWYAYVANQIAIEELGEGVIDNIYRGEPLASDSNVTGISDADGYYANVADFLDGAKSLQTGSVDNNPNIDASEWPLIQTYKIAENSLVTITYGTGTTATNVELDYDYDDTKDLSMDRPKYPAGADIIVALDDSLLNLSPTADDYWAFNSTDVFYFLDSDTALTAANRIGDWEAIGFEEGPLTYNAGNGIFNIQNSAIHQSITEINPGQGESLLILSESATDDNVFVNFGTDEKSNLITSTDYRKTGSDILSYKDSFSVLLDTFDGNITLANLTEEWLSGVEISIELLDEDRNLSSLKDEDMTILNGEVPYIKMGEPTNLSSNTITIDGLTLGGSTDSEVYTVSKAQNVTTVTISGAVPYADYSEKAEVFNYVNFDFTELGEGSGTYYMGTSETPQTFSDGITLTTNATTNQFEFVIADLDNDALEGEVYFDILSFGQKGPVADPATGDINSNIERVNDAFYRFMLEETDDNTAKFAGNVEYLMINQLNANDKTTYDSIETADKDVVIIVNDDMDGVDAVRVSYNDVVSTGNDKTISVQEDANTHSGVITFDTTSYSSGNTITVTLDDVDLNTDSNTLQTYTISNIENWVGEENVWLSQLTFNDELYKGCEYTEPKSGAEYDPKVGSSNNPQLGLNSTSFSFVETDTASGKFVGTLQLPTEYCNDSGDVLTTNGVNIEFEYQDYSDASGNPNETSTKATVSSFTGSVSLDKTVYGVPFAEGDYLTHPSRTADGETALPATGTTVTIQVNDPDFNISANGEDILPGDSIALKLTRGSQVSFIDLSSYGDLVEIDPQAGIFEMDIVIDQLTDEKLSLEEGGLIHQGDILSVEYTDANDASGTINTVTDSATFDLRNGVLQADKSVYIIGSDAIITLIEPDLNLDSNTEETLSLELIEWDSDAGTTTLADDIFNAQPAGLRETGEDTGIFQVIIEIPKTVDEGDTLERGEQIDLEYTDQGPAGANFVGDEDEDVTTTIFTSNFGASVELDQKVYSWTDKVYITIVAPDHNFDDNKIDEIGGKDKLVQVYTRSDKIKDYKFVETGSNTGIFTGEVILTGFTHDADGDGDNDLNPAGASGSGPTDGLLPAGDTDGITVSFEFSDNEVSQGSSLIRWNIGEVQFLEASYPAKGSGVVRVIDPDMNLNPEAVDSFDINVWSDSAAGGVKLSVTETNEATGIFEGTLIFSTTDASSGSRLRVSEGDTVTAEYNDNTLPAPYNKSDELRATSTTLIGTVVPPLERAPVANVRAVDAFGNSLDTVQSGQQIQLTADIVNGQDRTQTFAYLIQIQNSQGVTVSLSWITGELTSGQQFSPAVSWIPELLDEYTATAFVWESVDNPTALSPPVTAVIVVNS